MYVKKTNNHFTFALFENLSTKKINNKRAHRALGCSPKKRSKVTVKPFTEDHLCCTPNIKALVDFDKKIYNSL